MSEHGGMRTDHLYTDCFQWTAIVNKHRNRCIVYRRPCCPVCYIIIALHYPLWAAVANGWGRSIHRLTHWINTDNNSPAFGGIFDDVCLRANPPLARPARPVPTRHRPHALKLITVCLPSQIRLLQLAIRYSSLSRPRILRALNDDDVPTLISEEWVLGTLLS